MHAKKYLHYLFILISPLVFSHCGPSSQFQYVAQEYKDLGQFNVTVLVLPYIGNILEPDNKNIFISKKNSEKKPVSGREVDLLESYMFIILQENTMARLVQPDASFNLKNLNFSYQQIENESGENVSLFVPTTNKIVIKEETPDYILVFEDLYFIKSAEDKPISVGQGSSNYFVMVGGIDYLLWDNKKGKIAAYGKLSRKLQLFSIPSKEDYLALFENFADEIIQNSPLLKRDIRF